MSIPESGGEISKRLLLVEIIDRLQKYKTSSWNINGLIPDDINSNIGSTVYYRGETHRFYAVHLN